MRNDYLKSCEATKRFKFVCYIAYRFVICYRGIGFLAHKQDCKSGLRVRKIGKRVCAECAAFAPIFCRERTYAKCLHAQCNSPPLDANRTAWKAEARLFRLINYNSAPTSETLFPPFFRSFEFFSHVEAMEI